MWCTEVVMCNYSYHSCGKKNDLFASIFPDSKVASQFRLGKTKYTYMILYEIAPYVTDVLNDAIQEVPIYSLSFDESYNLTNVLAKLQPPMFMKSLIALLKT